VIIGAHKTLACDADLEDVRALLGRPLRRSLATPTWRTSELGSVVRLIPSGKAASGRALGNECKEDEWLNTQQQ
jgi:hypothetical protein